MTTSPEPETAAVPSSPYMPRPPAETGRPSLCTPEVVGAICKAIREDGMSDTAAGALAGVSRSTLSRWKQEDDQLSLVLEQARALFQLERVRAIAGTRKRDGSLDWRAQVWLLKFSSPEEYGTPSRRRQARKERLEEEERHSKSSSPGAHVLQPEHLAALQALRLQVLNRTQEEEKTNTAAGSVANSPETHLATVDVTEGSSILPEPQRTADTKHDDAIRPETRAPLASGQKASTSSHEQRTRRQAEEREQHRILESILMAPDLDWKMALAKEDAACVPGLTF